MCLFVSFIGLPSKILLIKMTRFHSKLFKICLLFLMISSQISAQSIFGFLKSLVTDSTISTDKNKVKFFLYPSNENLDNKEELIIGDEDILKDSSYKRFAPLKVIIHGFLSKENNPITEVLTTAYLEESYDVNIIGVDWTALSTANSVLPEIFYALAINNVEVVAKQLSTFLEFLLKQGVLLGPEDVHLIGFSLGAHIAGMSGSNFYHDTGELLERITGLDPAGPVFQALPESARLDKFDAKFVDITHTNKESYGFNRSLGHVDFYANGGGTIQPDCEHHSFLLTGTCSHNAAYRYFAKSIHEIITACQCEIQPSGTEINYREKCLKRCRKPVVFGERCPSDARGNYYVTISVENQ